MKTIIIGLAVLLFACSKPQVEEHPNCKWVNMYMDSLVEGKVVSSYRGYHEIRCGVDLDSTWTGWYFFCDSNHIRRVEIEP